MFKNRLFGISPMIGLVRFILTFAYLPCLKLRYLPLIILPCVAAAQATKVKVEVNFELEAYQAFPGVYLWRVHSDPVAANIEIIPKVNEAELVDSLLDTLKRLKGSDSSVLPGRLNEWAEGHGGSLSKSESQDEPDATAHDIGKPPINHRLVATAALREVRNVRVYLISRSAASPGPGPRKTIKEGVTMGPFSEDFPPPKPQSLADFKGAYQLGLKSGSLGEESLSHITAEYFFTARDLAKAEASGARPHGDNTPKTELEKRYEMLSAMFMVRLVEAGVRPGMIYDSKTINEAMVTVANSILGIQAGDGISHLKGSDLILAFTDVTPPQVRITDKDGKPFEGKLEKYGNDLSARYITGGRRKRLITHPSRPLLAEGTLADDVFLMKDPLVAKSEAEIQPNEKGEAPMVDFKITPKPGANRPAATIGIAYSPEKDWTALLGASYTNPEGSMETLKFSIEPGIRTLSGTGDIAFSLHRGDLIATQLVLHGASDDRDESYFGNFLRPSFESTRSTGDLALRFSMDSITHEDHFYASEAFKLGRKRWRQTTTVETGIRYTDVSLEGNPSAIAGLDDGDAAGPYLKLVHLADYDGRSLSGQRSWQRILVGSELRIDSGLESLADSRDFIRAQVSSEAEGYFRVDGEIAGYVAAGITGAWASDDTPTYALPGAGGAPFIRGIQEDEYIGREFIGGHLEAGVSIPWLTSKIKRRNSATAAKLTDEAQQYYVAAFADFGRMSDLFQDGANLGGSKNFQGYGIQLQITQGAVWEHISSLAVGYAYSPQSRQHESGTIYSKASFDF